MNNLVQYKKGTWTSKEDELLRGCIEKYGEGKWNLIATKAGSSGLKRCRKSCRVRWLNYLTPNIRRGRFTEDEVDLIKRMHKLLGNRWALIAGRLPGRTANDVKCYWNAHQRLTKAPEKQQRPKANLITASKIPIPRPKALKKSFNLEHKFDARNICMPTHFYTCNANNGFEGTKNVEEDLVGWGDMFFDGIFDQSESSVIAFGAKIQTSGISQSTLDMSSFDYEEVNVG